MKKLVFALSPAILVSACSDSNGADQTSQSEEMETAAEAPKNEVTVKPIDPATTIDAGLTVGAQAPMDTAFETKDGDTDLAGIVANGPAVLIFTRSVSWCPFCQTQLKSVNAIVDDLKERGYSLYGVSYDTTEEQNRFSMNQMLDYGMLSDQGSKAIDAFGLRDPQYTEGRAVGVPYAAVMVIGEDGKVITKSVSSDYKMRPTNDQILELIDSI